MTTDPLNGVLLEGRYRVDARIATGGMSTVYRGLDVRLDRPVALKVMDARYTNDSQFLTRFQREARAVARLKDPGLVAVYDQGGGGSSREAPFLVMELVEGGTLRELLRERGPMPPHAAAAVLRPVLGGLATAHHAGLVHRDVKPENVLISDDGEVKLVDFGLVRAVAEAGITSTSVILGTAAYLSPEQVGSGAADARSDVYAVGIMAYELLTGTTPFTGDNPLTVAYQRMDHDVPPPSAAISGVPRQFDEFIGRAAARDADERFADAEEMAEDLDAIANELALPKFRVPAPKNSAQHTAATALHSRPTDDHRAAGAFPAAPVPSPAPAVKNPTRQLIRDPRDWQHTSDDDERPDAASQFAGIEMGEFIWEQQRARRSLVFWVLSVLLLAGGMAAAGWMLGTNLQALIH